MLLLALAVLGGLAFILDLVTDALPSSPIVWLVVALAFLAAYLYFYARPGRRRL